MNAEMSPRIRTLVSGLTAIATTSLLMTTLLEYLNPRQLQSSGELSTPASATAVDMRSNAALIRSV